ncbi:hypothetical protein N7535_009518 [Penicillium sp. DV-2018c]|nr:hypothetical protein N7461_001999 [Penicillium sp. DV-2018c]KAJ5559290.1 hypothetical protein N7535_009518 [Penicillium sp. DV-2018c]
MPTPETFELIKYQLDANIQAGRTGYQQFCDISEDIFHKVQGQQSSTTRRLHCVYNFERHLLRVQMPNEAHEDVDCQAKSNQVSTFLVYMSPSPFSMGQSWLSRLARAITAYRLHSERNDARLNPYNPVISMAWLANIDIAPCTGAEALANYLSKHVSKPERPTQSYLDMMRGIVPHVNDRTPLLTALRKMMNALLSCHLYPGP